VAIMLFFLLILAMFVAGLVHLFRQYILRIKEPTVEELWEQLDQQPWFQELLEHSPYALKISNLKDQGILKDVHYVRKLLHHQGTIDGFIHYIKE
jgi:hypothetical protein